jgi:hypothetical protein
MKKPPASGREFHWPIRAISPLSYFIISSTVGLIASAQI